MSASDESRGGSSRSVGASALVRFATFPITALATLATTSLVIGYTGSVGYAAIAVISTIVQMLPFADLGIGAGVINAVSEAPPNGDERQRAFASGFRILLISGVTVAILGVVVACTVTWPTLLSVSDSGLDGLNAATVLVVLLLSLSIPLGVGQRVLTGLLRNPLVVGINSLLPIISLAATASVVILSLPPALLAAAPALGQVMSAAVATILASRSIAFRWSSLLHRREFRFPGLLRTGAWYLVVSITATLIYQFGRVLLASRTDLQVVAEYSIVLQLYTPIWSFFAVSGAALWPIFARHRASGSSSRSLTLRMITLFGLAGVVCLVGLMLWGGWFTAWLSHSKIHVSVSVLAACGIMIIVQAVQLVLGVFLTSDSGLRFQALWGIPLSMSVLAGIWIAAPYGGAAVPFIATAIGVTIFRIAPNSARVWRDLQRPSE